MNSPKSQFAVQLVGHNQLVLNPSKPVPTTGPLQILAKVECVGLCFSDLKLLKQFSDHPRKSPVVSGLDSSILSSIPSYVPNEKPTVPGHEAVVRIVAVGSNVQCCRVGDRRLVQTDYRALPTAHSNAAFGYNFEGALQEYVLFDERVVIDPASHENFLIPVPESLGASAIALIEPWACVENSYATPERNTLKQNGALLVVSQSPISNSIIKPLLDISMPATIQFVKPDDVASLPDESFDDILYFGVHKTTVEPLSDKLAPRGVMNIVQGGKRFSAPVSVGVGRVHYGMTRWIGTAGDNPLESYQAIPSNGELCDKDKILVLGAAGPMGQMHVIRAVCSAFKSIEIVAADMDDARLECLSKKASSLAEKNGVNLRLVNTKTSPLNEKFSYIALMAPIPALVAQAINDSQANCRINIFAGIPASAKQEIDLDRYIANRCYMFGTSGSVIGDMKTVLEKVQKRQLDANCSVDAVCGMAGAINGLSAVENRTLSGKIIVYPALHDLKLTPLSDLQKQFPAVAEKLDNGQWTREAELELLKHAR